MEEAKKRAQLRKHKRIATGLFFLMAVIYGLMVYFQHTSPQAWMGYVEAFSEAGMVGALADWFAVTALFRHPLGIPIPHTNLIERKKNDLGANLGVFVNENFLNSTTIRPYIERLDVSKLMTDWLEKPANREGLESEIRNLLRTVILDLEDEEVKDYLTLKATDLLKKVDYQNLAAVGITYLIEKDEHNNLLNTLLPQVKSYIKENESMVLSRIAASRPLIAILAGKKISKEVIDGILSFISEVEKDDRHFVRQKISENLLKIAAELKETGKWDSKFTRLTSELITPKTLEPYISDIWRGIKQSLLENLEDSESKLQEYLEKTILKLSIKLKTDQEIQQRINNWIRHFVYRMVLKNRQEVEELIGTTVANWSGKELSEKLELEVGKDLQFIRVNGTLVGGLVGLLIYIITHLFI